MSELILTRGVPGSGKSTWALEQAIRDSNIVRVNRDDIREEPELRARFAKQLNGKPYYARSPFAEYEEQVTLLQHNRIRENLRTGKKVICDDTNLNNRFVKQLRKIGEQEGAKVSHRDFPIPLEEAKRRNRLRDRVVPDHVIERAYAGLGPNGELSYWDGDYDHKVRPIVLPTERKQVFAFDMDGTLADTRPIQHYVQGKYRNFDAFHRLSEFTRPNQQAIDILVDAHKNGFGVIITTARNEYFRAVTQKWLDREVTEKYGIPVDNIFMRADNDMRPDYVVKKEMYENYIKDNYDVIRFTDDNPQAVQAWKELGQYVTEVPFYGGARGMKADKAIEQGWAAFANAAEVPVTNIFSSGKCIRCGRPLNNGELLGPNCKKLS